MSSMSLPRCSATQIRSTISTLVEPAGTRILRNRQILATDLLSGEAVIISDGPVAPAIMASTAIPAAFAPVQIDGLYLADGAITSCTPVHQAVVRGATRLIVLPTGFACARQAPPQDAVANALHTLTLLITRQMLSELEGLDDGIEYHVAPPLCR